MSVPDANIHPVATGFAAETVAKHQAPQELVFYAGWFCPYVQRAWITLEEKGIPYQYKEVNPYKKEKHFLEINPKGLVPAVEYKGKALYESLIICEFLEDAYPTYGPHLLTTDPYTKAYVSIWVDYITKNVVPNFMRLVQAQEREKQEHARQDFYKGLRGVSEKVKGPYFLDNRGYSREDVGEKWASWAGELEKRDSVLHTQSNKEYYAEIYGRYLRDEAQSEAAKAIREGRAIP
ncbi:hypothetical protein ABKN59_006672 [Abortiporus biennis]